LASRLGSLCSSSSWFREATQELNPKRAGSGKESSGGKA
jgi:hypothetical protein